jgi:hypothetical protein
MAAVISVMPSWGGDLAEFLPQDRALLSSSDYLALVKAKLVSFEPAVRMGDCKTFTPLERSSVTLLDHVMRGVDPDGKTPLERKEEFQASSYSRALLGAWTETWTASMCGKTVVRRLTMMRKAEGTLDAMPQVPGATLADFRLQIDTLKIGLPAFLLPSCEDARFAVLDTSPVEVNPPLRWTEKWTLTRCGTTASRIVSYLRTPDGGTNISVSSEAAK